MKKINIKSISILFISSIFIFSLLSSVSSAVTTESFGGSAVSPTYITTGANGCNASNITNFKSLVTTAITCLLNPLVILMVGLSIAVFVFGIFKMIASNSVEDKEKGREFIFWGIIGIFVMLSLWGLVNILKSSFVLNTDITPRTINISL